MRWERRPSSRAPLGLNRATANQSPREVWSPSCVLTGQQLYNFALTDLNGQPWEFRNHRSKLVLLDFWGSWCMHCLNSIPHLRIATVLNTSHLSELIVDQCQQPRIQAIGTAINVIGEHPLEAAGRLVLQAF